eukprot:Hpha_TRINITY_DN16843_c1_g2::TRINITY_DN16843_c1_g2_i2::g.152215::m.152215
MNLHVHVNVNGKPAGSDHCRVTADPLVNEQSTGALVVSAPQHSTGGYSTALTPYGSLQSQQPVSEAQLRQLYDKFIAYQERLLEVQMSVREKDHEIARRDEKIAELSAYVERLQQENAALRADSSQLRQTISQQFQAAAAVEELHSRHADNVAQQQRTMQMQIAELERRQYEQAVQICRNTASMSPPAAGSLDDDLPPPVTQVASPETVRQNSQPPPQQQQQQTISRRPSAVPTEGRGGRSRSASIAEEIVRLASRGASVRAASEDPQAAGPGGSTAWVSDVIEALAAAGLVSLAASRKSSAQFDDIPFAPETDPQALSDAQKLSRQPSAVGGVHTGLTEPAQVSRGQSQRSIVAPAGKRNTATEGALDALDLGDLDEALRNLSRRSSALSQGQQLQQRAGSRSSLAAAAQIAEQLDRAASRGSLVPGGDAALQRSGSRVSAGGASAAAAGGEAVAVQRVGSRGSIAVSSPEAGAADAGALHRTGSRVSGAPPEAVAEMPVQRTGSRASVGPPPERRASGVSGQGELQRTGSKASGVSRQPSAPGGIAAALDEPAQQAPIEQPSS